MTYKYQGRSLGWYLAIPRMAVRLVQMKLERMHHEKWHLDDFKAQYHEDRELSDMFKRQNGYCVEVGANNGVEASNTYYFEQLGWKGLCVEADPAMADDCRRNRPGFTTVHTAAVGPDRPETVTFQVVEKNTGLSALAFDDLHQSRIEMFTGGFETKAVTVPAKTLDRILEEHNAPALDFITIDVEGFEMEVLRGFTITRWKPKVVILERDTDEMDEEILDYMRRHGYKHFRTTPEGRKTGNDWYVPVSSSC
jgi:FkbM family methyltransferase